MRMASSLLASMCRIMRHPPFWLLVVMFAIIVILHYPQQLPFGDTAPFSFLGLARHAVERVFLLVPIAYASFIFGIRGGIASLVVAAFILLPRAIFVSPAPADALFESCGIIVIGGIVNLWFYMHRRDITRRKSVEEMLTKIVDGSSIASFVINRQHKVTHWNTAIASLSGIKKEKVIGTDGQWQPFYNEKRPVMADLIVDGASVNEIEAFYRGKCKKSNLIEGAYEAEDLFPALGKNGKWLRFTASPIRGNSGEITGAIETLEDITGRRNAEAKLRESERMFRGLFENALDAIFVHDLEGDIQAANDAAASLTGYSVEELCQANISLFLTRDGRSLAHKIRDKLIQGELIEMPYELRLIKKDGSEAACEFTANLIAGYDKPPAVQHICRDVTEEKRLYENLRFYLQEITRAQEEERKRIARELHDSTAQTLIALLHQLENVLTEKGKLSVREARVLWGFHERLRDVLQEVRRFSRDLRPPILDDLGLLPALEWATRELKREYGVETSLKVVGTERRLSQEAELLFFRIVQEALWNTAKHAQASRAEVKLRFDENKTGVTISDDGIGFQPPENLGDLPYIGKLGLAGIQERVQLLGGSLKIESELGKGTTIFVKAPV
jgi:PAS domain S-box-containing protein